MGKISIDKAKIKNLLGNNTSLIAIIILMTFGGFAYGGTFLNYKLNLINVLHAASMLGIMGVGVNMCFFIGARDMSVGAVGASASMITAMLSPYGLIPSILGGLFVGAFFGLFNGYITTRFKVQPFVATLGTQLAARGVALLLNDELSITLDPSATVIKAIGNANIFGILPIPAAIFLTLIFGLSIVMKRTPFGRAIYAVGGNEEAAEMMGIRTSKIKMAVFLISGLTSAMAGIVLCGRINAGQPTSFQGWEMTIMAAVVIGGTNVSGGRGKIKGIFWGVLFIQLITNLINLNGHISAYWKDIITGVILLLAVLIQAYGDKRKARIKNTVKKEVVPACNTVWQ